MYNSRCHTQLRDTADHLVKDPECGVRPHGAEAGTHTMKQSLLNPQLHWEPDASSRGRHPSPLPRAGNHHIHTISKDYITCFKFNTMSSK